MRQSTSEAPQSAPSCVLSSPSSLRGRRDPPDCGWGDAEKLAVLDREGEQRHHAMRRGMATLRLALYYNFVLAHKPFHGPPFWRHEME